MANDKTLTPIILECISWVKGMMGPSKKDMMLRISDLTEKVQSLSSQNDFLYHNQAQIIQSVLEYIGTQHGYTVNVDSIVFVGGNVGTLEVMKPTVTGSHIIGDVATKQEGFDVSKIFEGADEEIVQAKMFKPSDRR